MLRPNGSKYWRLKYRINNKEKLLALGVYPEISLLEAREKRREARKMIDGGIDPSHDKKKQKSLSQTNSDNTFEAIAREWHDNHKSKWSERYAEGIMTRLETYIFPEIGRAQRVTFMVTRTASQTCFGIQRIERWILTFVRMLKILTSGCLAMLKSSADGRKNAGSPKQLLEDLKIILKENY